MNVSPAVDTAFTGLTSLCLQRPLATLMFFIGVALLGVFSWCKIPVELIPALQGERLHVRFSQVAASPDTLERDILLPLEAQVRRLSGVVDTRAKIEGSSGSLDIEFERDIDLKVRSLELQTIAAEINRRQPQGSIIEVASQNLGALSRFVMSLQVVGPRDVNGLRDTVEERVRAGLVATAGVSRVFVVGGGEMEVSVQLDTERCAELKLSPSEIANTLERSIQGLQYLGASSDYGLQWMVVLDSGVSDLSALKNTPVDPSRGILLRHVAEVTLKNRPNEGVFRVNGQRSVGVLIFKEDGANIAALGEALKGKIEQLNQELLPYSIEIIQSFDASRVVADLLGRLKVLALAGFLIALFVLYLFLKQLSAVATIAIAVPISLLVAGALLYLSGHSLNIITLFGLSIGIGMLVDNSVVVYEAVNRCLEKGLDPQSAALTGVGRTMRAVVAATATNAVVLLPLIIFVDDVLLQQLMKIIAAAILLPLLASLLVASTLVPLMAQGFASAALEKRKTPKGAYLDGNGNGVDLVRELFAAILKVSLRSPSKWATRLALVLILTLVIALPIVWLRSVAQPAPDASEVKVELALAASATLDAASLVFQRLETIVWQQPGVNKVESYFFEDTGTLTVYLDRQAKGLGAAHAQRVRRAIDDAVRSMDTVQIKTESAEGSSGLSLNFDRGDVGTIAISGPDMWTLRTMAEAIAAKLEAKSEIASVSISGTTGPSELILTVDRMSALFHRLDSSTLLNTVHMAGREGELLQASFSSASGREFPITIRQTNIAGDSALDKLTRYRVLTEQGVLPLDALVQRRIGQPPPTINHHNGRRELAINYRFVEADGAAGDDRLLRENVVNEAIRSLHKPAGYIVENQGVVDPSGKFHKVYVPVLLLLVAVLTLTFESLTLPLLVLLTVPMTLVGGVWGLFFAGFGVEMMALVGLIVLFGLAVNPAILLIDRIQQKMRSGHYSAGGAVIIAVRERARPVLVTACTTMGGLWPMTLVSGQEMEIWPAFAAVVMGGVAISTLLTLLVIPVVYVLVNRFDRKTLALSTWQLSLWLGLSGAIVGWLVSQEYLLQPGWQILTSTLIAASVYWCIAKLSPAPQCDNSLPELPYDTVSMESRYIGKTYNPLGPFARTWNKYKRDRESVRVGERERVERTGIQLLLAVATFYLANQLHSPFWRIAFVYMAGLFLAFGLASLYAFYQTRNNTPQAAPRVRAILLVLSPWLVLFYLFIFRWLMPTLAQHTPSITVVTLVMLPLLTVLLQLGRRCAIAVVEGRLEPKVEGPWQLLRNGWRNFCVNVLGFDIRPAGFTALGNINFTAQSGMIGILGPNGAGKSTFLRIVSSILEPSVGTLLIAGRDRRLWARDLASQIGYLPQEFGLYNHMTAREYLDYFAILYRVGSKPERCQRVEYLLKEVGLEKRQHEKLGGFSGGMRQRVAVARTFLRLPPILVVDEPTVGLDSRERIRFRNLLAKLAQDRIVLFSTHVVEDVAISSNRVLVLKEGAIVYDGSPQQLADVASGKVWVLHTTERDMSNIERHSKIVTQIGEGNGNVRLRILSQSKPHHQAEAQTPTLEDGYLCLFSEKVNMQ